jgi:hypothetical protein
MFGGAIAVVQVLVTAMEATARVHCAADTIVTEKGGECCASGAYNGDRAATDVNPYVCRIA